MGSNIQAPLRRRKRIMQPQTDEQRLKRACPLAAKGPISKAMKGLVGGAAQGSAECRKNWTTALVPRSSGSGTDPTGAEHAEAARVAWRRYRVTVARQLAPMIAPCATGERQEHLDAIAPSRERGRGDVCLGTRHPHHHVGNRRLTRRMSILSQHAAHFYEKRKGPNHEMVR